MFLQISTITTQGKKCMQLGQQKETTPPRARQDPILFSNINRCLHLLHGPFEDKRVMNNVAGLYSAHPTEFTWSGQVGACRKRPLLPLLAWIKHVFLQEKPGSETIICSLPVDSKGRNTQQRVYYQIRTEPIAQGKVCKLFRETERAKECL